MQLALVVKVEQLELQMREHAGDRWVDQRVNWQEQWCTPLPVIGSLTNCLNSLTLPPTAPKLTKGMARMVKDT